jgi:hypothetical protein
MHNCLLVLKEAVRYPWRSPMRNTFYVAIKKEKIMAQSVIKFQKNHIPDLHFVHPTVTTEEVKNPKVLISLLTGDNS